MTDPKTDRAFSVLSNVAAGHGFTIGNNEQPLNFGTLLSSEEQARAFGREIKSHNYSIDPDLFVALYKQRIIVQVGALVTSLAGKDDTHGDD